MAKSDEKAFALKAEYESDFAGASLALGPEGKTVDLKARLDNGGGTIRTSDPVEIAAYRQHEALKEVSAESAKAGGKG